MPSIVNFTPNYAFSDGEFAPGALASFFLAGTTTPVTVYTDQARTIAHPTPVVADASGRFPAIWGEDGVNLKAVVTEADSSAIDTFDPVVMVVAPGSQLIAANDLSDLGDADAALTNLGGTATGTTVFKAASAAAALTGLGLTATAAELNRTTGLTSSAQTQIDAKAPLAANAPQSRWRCNYFSGTRLQIHGGESVMMGGFRFLGNYKKQGRFINTGVNGFTDLDSADASADLGVETARQLENWYAAFAVANSSDATCEFKLMPYLRAQAVAGSVITLGEAGEGKHTPFTATTYAWAADSLDGVDCLVICENGEWSGRVTTITANTTGSVTLADASGIVAGDFLLPAPPGFTEYAWLVDHYMDTAEWRNIADTGIDAGSTMTNQTTVAATGAIAAVEASFAGYISPLATQAVVKLQFTASTASTGVVSHYFWHDSSSHIYWRSFDKKDFSATETYIHGSIRCPFSKKQSIWITADGSVSAATVSRTVQVYGWSVP